VTLEPGARFAGFTVVRRLGSGGMGEVYLVEHPRLPRQEALKVLSETYTDNQEYRARFQREAELAASVWHPHLVALHDRGEDDGRLWISMDYIDGSDMARLVRTKYPAGMPVGEALQVITATASALDYAHGRGMLHRDVKPSNILVSEGPFHEQRIALADFGIARAIDDMAGLTGTNFALGTVEYAAPEQLRGRAIDARADQYALAATAFQLLTGSPPFAGSGAVEVISQHLTDTPPSLGATKPELAVMDGVFARAMAKDPAMRFNTCGEFASSLEAAGRAAPAAPAGPPVDAAVPYPTTGPVPAMPPTMPAHAYNENFHRAETQRGAVAAAPTTAAAPTAQASKAKSGETTSSRALIFRVATVFVAVLLLTAAAVFVVNSHRATRQVFDAWKPYRDAAPNIVTAVTALDYRTVDTDLQRFADATTGDLQATFERERPGLREAAVGSQSIVTVDTKQVAVEVLRPSAADVLVTAVRTTTRNGVRQEPEELRIRITLNEVSAGVFKASSMGFLE
jgi:serine/threonine-protein kinase